MNYQVKWTVYRSWCHRHGHSVSLPTVAKVADFLLFLRRSLSLSYSSIASYRSMLSSVFRFVLPELSSHFVLHDLLRSFRLERPLSSSRVPPWDLLSVLRFLCDAPFEPLSSSLLRDLIQKVLFLVSLATARRVSELQAVSCAVSMSGEDMFLSYLPEFRAKTASNLFLGPSAFVRCGTSLAIFLRNSCCVRCVHCMSTFLVLPLFLHTLVLFLFLLALLLVLFLKTPLVSSFVRSFRRLLLLRLLLPPFLCLPLLLPLLLVPLVLLLLLSVLIVFTGLLLQCFARNAPLSSVLAAATWSSTVFTSFYLKDVQFSSPMGFSLGPVVAAGAVV